MFDQKSPLLDAPGIDLQELFDLAPPQIEQKVVISKGWTYGWKGSEPLHVGDIVLLPPTPYAITEPFQDVIVATESDYDGPLKYVIRRI